MERIIIELILPAAERKWDVRVPLDLNVGVFTDMAAEALSQLSDNMFLPSKVCCLAWRDTGNLLSHGSTLRECGVQQGSRLMLL